MLTWKLCWHGVTDRLGSSCNAARRWHCRQATEMSSSAMLWIVGKSHKRVCTGKYAIYAACTQQETLTVRR